MNEKYTSYTIVVCRCDAVYDVWQIFEHSRDNPFCSMLITAEPGFGKTTLFNKIVSIWCTAYDTFRHRSNNSSYKRRNVLALQKNAFTFYISLCKLNNEESILQMITSQITGSSQYKSLEDILKNETCLFLLNGRRQAMLKENSYIILGNAVKRAMLSIQRLLEIFLTSDTLLQNSIVLLNLKT